MTRKRHGHTNKLHPLRVYLDARGLGYRPAAEALGCHFSTLSHICCGRRSKPSLWLARRIVEWSKGKITFEELFEG